MGPGLEPVIISFTKIPSSFHDIWENAEQKAGTLSDSGERRGDRGLEAEGAFRRLSEKRQNGRDIADWSLASVSKVCADQTSEGR